MADWSFHGLRALFSNRTLKRSPERMLRAAGSISAHDNQRSAWDAGRRFDFEHTEHR